MQKMLRTSAEIDALGLLIFFVHNRDEDNDIKDSKT